METPFNKVILPKGVWRIGNERNAITFFWHFHWFDGLKPEHQEMQYGFFIRTWWMKQWNAPRKILLFRYRIKPRPFFDAVNLRRWHPDSGYEFL